MELYIFLVTHLMQLAAAMVIVFNYFSDNMSAPLNSSNGSMNEITIRRLKRLKIYL